jgi:hypothetical protein
LLISLVIADQLPHLLTPSIIRFHFHWSAPAVIQDHQNAVRKQKPVCEWKRQSGRCASALKSSAKDKPRRFFIVVAKSR